MANLFISDPYSEYVVTVIAINGAGNGSNVTKKARTQEDSGCYYINIMEYHPSISVDQSFDLK